MHIVSQALYPSCVLDIPKLVNYLFISWFHLNTSWILSMQKLDIFKLVYLTHHNFNLDLSTLY